MSGQDEWFCWIISAINASFPGARPHAGPLAKLGKDNHGE
jgi:hypothetical protein